MEESVKLHLAQGSVNLNIDRLAFLLTELDKIHNEAESEKFPLFSLEKRKKDILKILEDGYLFYAEFQSQIIGFASILKRKESLLIEHLYVQTEFRHKKIGTKMVEDIFKHFPDKEIFASVYAFNSEAIKFYDSLFKLSSLVFKKGKCYTERD